MTKASTRKVRTDFWVHGKITPLNLVEKAVVLWATTAGHFCCIHQVSIRALRNAIDRSLSAKDIRTTLASLEERKLIMWDEDEELLWLIEGLDEQIGETNSSPKVRAAATEHLGKLPTCSVTMGFAKRYPTWALERFKSDDPRTGQLRLPGSDTLSDTPSDISDDEYTETQTDTPSDIQIQIQRQRQKQRGGSGGRTDDALNSVALSAHGAILDDSAGSSTPREAREPSDVATVLDAIADARAALGRQRHRRRANAPQVKQVRRIANGRKLAADQIEQWQVVIKHAAEYCRRNPTMRDGTPMLDAVLRLTNLSQPEKFAKWLERDDLAEDQSGRINGQRKVRRNDITGEPYFVDEWGVRHSCDENGFLPGEAEYSPPGEAG